jgi:diguanylate cyclase (GGDEF)-like protein/PAS domain S-box-containing protein
VRKGAGLNFVSFNEFFEQAGVGMTCVSLDGVLVDVNQKFCDMLGYRQDEIIGRPINDITHPDDHGVGARFRAEVAQGEVESVSSEKRFIRKDGSLIWVNHATSLARGRNGEPIHLITVAENISERKQAEEKLTQLAHYDVLTSLPNRMLFFDRLKLALAGAKRNDSKAGVMFIDLDRFKHINDTLGHAAGDDLLQQVAERLKESVRASDTVGRLGGDEFAIVLSFLAAARDADVPARKIMARFNEPFRLNQTELFVTASIGIAVYPDDSTDQDALIKNADLAMYRAKEEGRNTYKFFSPGMNAPASESQDMEVMLRRALERKEFVLHYQPTIALQGNRINGVEALIRWNSKELGPVPPMQFIPLAEETGLIAPIGAWVLKTACAQNKAWQDQGLPPLVMAVNLSPRQFRQKNLVQMIAGTLAETGLDPRWLELQITESIIMQHPEKSSAILQQFHEIGVQLSIDDFGTGYSSFADHKRFPVRRLKIEPSLVQDITTDADHAAIVAAVIGMAKSLKLEVVAEGVETKEQLAFLAQLRCDDYQGHYFSKPLPAEEFVRLTANSLR